MDSGAEVKSELSGDWLKVSTEISGVTTSEALAAFYEPDRVRRWWGGDLISNPLNDGDYTVHFAQLGQTMRGRLIEYLPGERFAFSWGWDHEPEVPGFRVTVNAVPIAEGTRLELEHGPYTQATRDEANGHRDGWEYFLPLLVQHLTQPDLQDEGP